eukprot:1390272-Alexandrium_andersonii.AAC.1
MNNTGAGSGERMATKNSIGATSAGKGSVRGGDGVNSAKGGAAKDDVRFLKVAGVAVERPAE